MILIVPVELSIITITLIPLSSLTFFFITVISHNSHTLYIELQAVSEWYITISPTIVWVEFLPTVLYDCEINSLTELYPSSFGSKYFSWTSKSLTELNFDSLVQMKLILVFQTRRSPHMKKSLIEIYECWFNTDSYLRHTSDGLILILTCRYRSIKINPPGHVISL